MVFWDKIDAIALRFGGKKLLADACDFSEQSFVNWRARGTIPSGRTLAKISAVTGVPVAVLLDDSALLEPTQEDIKQAAVRRWVARHQSLVDLLIEMPEGQLRLLELAAAAWNATQVKVPGPEKFQEDLATLQTE